jgi:16S rRNA (guanine966-N2)-methyltransferase
MRIIAGRFRRRTLETNPGLTTRPITDRVKETLFARIEAELQGRRVADVFSGTGTIGLEALSRGAERVTFIEKDRKAVELLRENIRKLKVEDETLVWPCDVLRCSFRPQRAEAFTPFDVIFFDPPYVMVDDLQEGTPLSRAVHKLAEDRVSAPNALMLLRVPEHAVFQLPPVWQPEWTLTMSNMSILQLRKTAAVVEPATAERAVDAMPE